jgi:hypothetical protein
MVATYYSRTGELDVEPVSEDLLVAAARRIIAGAEALHRLATGAEANRTPNPLCGWCDALHTCGPGQERAGTSVPHGGPRGSAAFADDETSGTDGTSADDASRNDKARP